MLHLPGLWNSQHSGPKVRMRSFHADGLGSPGRALPLPRTKTSVARQGRGDILYLKTYIVVFYQSGKQGSGAQNGFPSQEPRSPWSLRNRPSLRLHGAFHPTVQTRGPDRRWQQPFWAWTPSGEPRPPGAKTYLDVSSSAPQSRSQTRFHLLDLGHFASACHH